MAASGHSDAPQNWILPNPVIVAEKPAPRRVSGKSDGLEKPATSSINRIDELVPWRMIPATATSPP
jgi:hypothetical protein